MNGSYIRDFLSEWPAGQNGPVAVLSCRDPQGDASKHPSSGFSRGLALRLRLFEPDAVLRDVRLNGHPPAMSEADAVRTWRARGMTFVEVALPPERLAESDTFVVTVDYESRLPGTHWSPDTALARIR